MQMNPFIRSYSTLKQNLQSHACFEINIKLLKMFFSINLLRLRLCSHYGRIHGDVIVYIFFSLAYELTHSCIYRLGAKIKRVGQFMQFVQVLALCNQ